MTKHGKEIAVVVSIDEFHRLTGAKLRYKDFDDWLLSGPKDDEFADIMTSIRDKSMPRGVELARGVVPTVDCLIAATAQVRGWTVVTRNVRDFEPTGVPTLNPFEDAG